MPYRRKQDVHKPYSYEDATIIDAEIIEFPEEPSCLYNSRRPTLLTEELQQKLCDLAREGLHKTHIAAICEVNQSNLRYWLERSPDREPYRSFRDRFRKAEAEFAQADWKLLANPDLEDKYARKIQWRLEKRFPKLYGHRATVDHQVSYSVNEDQLRQLASTNPAAFERYMKALQEQEAVEGMLLGSGDDE